MAGFDELQPAPPSRLNKFLDQYRKLNPDFRPAYRNSKKLPVVALFGDSDISHWPKDLLPSENPENPYQLVCVGIGGAEMLHCAYYAEEFRRKYQPHVVVLCAGE